LKKNVNERLKVERGLDNYDDWKTESQFDEEEQEEALLERHERKQRMAEDRADAERDERQSSH